MAQKKRKRMIRVQIEGYIPAADPLDMESIKKQFATLDGLRAFAKEQFGADHQFKVKPVGRMVEETPTPPAPEEE